MQIGVDVFELIALNKPRYKSMTRARRLRRGTLLLIPTTSDYGGDPTTGCGHRLHHAIAPCDCAMPLHHAIARAALARPD